MRKSWVRLSDENRKSLVNSSFINSRTDGVRGFFFFCFFEYVLLVLLVLLLAIGQRMIDDVRESMMKEGG